MSNGRQMLMRDGRIWQDLAERTAAAWCSGDTQLAGELFVDLQGRSTSWLLAIAHRKGAGDAAEELVAQAYLELYQKIAGGEAVENVKGLLGTIVRRRVVDWHRRRRGVTVATGDDDFWQRHDGTSSPFAPVPDDFAGVEQQDAASRIVNAILDALPDDEREVLLARELDELDVAETARRLKLTEDQVKKRRQRAIASARRVAEEQGLRHDLD